MTGTSWFSCIVTACAVLGFGVGNGADVQLPGLGEAGVPDQRLELKQFRGSQACGALESYIANSFTEQFLTRFRCLGFGPCPLFLGAPTEGDAAIGAPAASPVPERVSDTNTQESGVDEADIVKSDRAGNLYILTGQRLVVMDAFPPAGLEQRAQAVLDLAADDPNFYASDFFLDETAQRLVALGSSYSDQGGRSISLIVDVSTPSAPAIVQRLAVDGYPLEARRIGARVHRVSRFDVPLPAGLQENTRLQRQREDYFSAEDQGRQRTANRIRKDIRSAILNFVDEDGARRFLPRIHDGNRSTPLACRDVLRPDMQTGFGLAVLESFNTDGGGHRASAAVNNSYLVYASAQNLYLAQNSSGWFNRGTKPTDETVIYRFELSATEAPSYKGLGRVPGSVIGSYALSEHEGHLRVASTENPFTDFQPSVSVNHLTVLQANDQKLSRVGGVSGYAPGEFIRGVRFLGNRGFVVTFRQVDPLFAFDLSDPQAPQITDELKIPGFSSYLLPLGRDHLLTIGRAGDEEQLNGRIAIQLFDVRNLRSIHQTAVIEPTAGGQSYSYSTAEYDPHAFAYFPDTTEHQVPGTLSVPLQISRANGQTFSGFLAVRVNPESDTPLEELARLDHGALADSAGCGAPFVGDDGALDTAVIAPNCPDPGLTAEPRRSAYAQDSAGTYLYTISSLGVLASNALNPKEELGRARLPYDPPQCCFIQPLLLETVAEPATAR